jgi:hypothetical protein
VVSCSRALLPDHQQHLLYYLAYITFTVYIMSEVASSPQRRPASLERIDSQSTYTSFRDKMARALSPNGRAHDGELAPSIGTRRPSIGRESLHQFCILLSHPACLSGWCRKRKESQMAKRRLMKV